MRYGQFSEEEHFTREVEDVAGDNAVYLSSAMARHASTFARGFWEVDLHRRLRSEGVRLVLSGGAVVDFSGAPALTKMVIQRISHGRHFGAWRSANGGRSAALTLVFAPVIPLVLMVRIVRRVWRRRYQRLTLLSALPALAVLACAWAIGETLGALFGANTGHTSES